MGDDQEIERTMGREELRRVRRGAGRVGRGWETGECGVEEQEKTWRVVTEGNSGLRWVTYQGVRVQHV